MKLFSTLPLVSLLAMTSAFAQAPSINIEKSTDTGAYIFRLAGDDGTDWQLQVSADLENWTVADLTRGEGNSWEYDPETELTTMFYRAIREATTSAPGLYDPGTYRIMNLEFEEANWVAQLTTNYGTDVNVSATLTVDGVSYEGVGVRYKGDTSYRNATTTKKSFAIEVDNSDPETLLMGYKTLNLNNAFSDASFMREVLYNNFCRDYVPSPQTNFVHLFVNGSDYGVYINAQQENGDFINEFFQDNDGDRWRAGLVPSTTDNGGGGGRPPGSGGGGGGGNTTGLNFGGDLSWLGTDVTLYESGYILKTDKNPDPWTALVKTIDVLNNTAIEELPSKLDEVMAVDRFLWLLALENLFLDSDGYLAKAGDYLLYHDINTGRPHPIQHDGNETFNADATEISGGVSAPPFYGEDLAEERPLTARLFAIDAYRQRYLAHLRTILTESFHWDYFEPRITAYATMIESDVLADNAKQTTNAQFLASIDADDSELREFVEARRNFLLTHADVDRDSPSILAAEILTDNTPVAATPVTIQGVLGDGPSVGAMTLYYTEIQDGAFTSVSMEAMEDGSFEGSIPGMLAGTTVYYYIEAQASDAVGTLSYFPAHAEGSPLTYQVGLEEATEPQIAINEVMAKNGNTLADPAGEFDDWIELANLSDQAIDLSGMYLSDKDSNPRKWTIPDGTMIDANSYLIIWADEDTAQEGLHANFKLSSAGETITLVSSDVSGNLLLDSLTFGELAEDVSYGRTSNGETAELIPSPGTSN